MLTFKRAVVVDPWANLKIDLEAKSAKLASWGVRLLMLMGTLLFLALSAWAARSFRRRDATEEEARVLSHGGPLAPIGAPEPYAVFAPDGTVLGIVRERDGKARAEVVLVP